MKKEALCIRIPRSIFAAIMFYMLCQIIQGQIHLFHDLGYW